MAELSGKRCAEVLLEYAKRQGNLEQMYKDAVFVRAVLQKYTDLSRLLSVPTLSRCQRDHILEQLFGGNIDGGLLTVLQTLAGKRLIGEFPLIADHLESAYREYMQEATVQVCSARPLSARQKQSLEKRLSETAGYRSVDVRYKVDQALLGGMVIRIRDRIVDGSLRTKLNRIRDELLSAAAEQAAQENTQNEKREGR
ncbi:MAG: ATP synthase F1 subunit delta [Lachnospiraceae bacterium]